MTLIKTLDGLIPANKILSFHDDPVHPGQTSIAVFDPQTWSLVFVHEDAEAFRDQLRNAESERFIPVTDFIGNTVYIQINNIDTFQLSKSHAGDATKTEIQYHNSLKIYGSPNSAWILPTMVRETPEQLDTLIDEELAKPAVLATSEDSEPTRERARDLIPDPDEQDRRKLAENRALQKVRSQQIAEERQEHIRTMVEQHLRQRTLEPSRQPQRDRGFDLER